MSVDEKRRYVEAFVKLKDPGISPSVLHPGSQSRYDDYAELHMMSMMPGAGWAHRGPAFFPWHRELLYQFEKDLQASDATVMVPYWDWAKVHSSADSGWPFTHDFLGVDGVAADSFRVPRDPAHAADPPASYPHPFDPQQWEIVITDAAGDDTRLQRHFGSFTNATTLPSLTTGSNSEQDYLSALGAAVYDASPWSANTGNNLRSRSEGTHNRVHRWVGGFLVNPDANFDAGGTMYKMTSPNDPIFFLHHAQIDRMWNIWQARHPGTTSYLPTTGAASGHNLNDDLIFHHPGETALWPGNVKPGDLLNSHTIHGSGIWYDTDIPEITLETPTVDFGDVPEGLTTYRAARFRVKTCQRTSFRVTVAPTGNFGLADGQTDFYVDPRDDAEEVFGLVFFQFHSVAGAQPPVIVTIQPFIVDREGEYTNTIDAEFNVGPAVDVTLIATSVPRTDYAIALVLDRSGSMAFPAGPSSTRSDLLRNAVSVFADLMRETEQVGVVNFDDEVATLTSPAMRLMDAAGRASIQAIAIGADLAPRGETGIGLGITEGHNTLLTAAPGLSRAMLVFTDGHQNVPPDVSALPAGIIDSRTYAIGFGRVNDVNRDVLDDITDRTNGDLIITGEISSDEQRFLLTKYFVQVLAGVEKLQIVLDPDGQLVPGVETNIPFTISNADIEADVIVLTPAPFAVAIDLITPGGDTITRATPGPNARFFEGRQVEYYRMLLPALPANPGSSHAGQWKAVLRVDEESVREAIAGREREPEKFKALIELARKGTVPYSVLVHVRSNLEFEVKGTQSGSMPGSTMTLNAALREYDVPYRGHANVWTEIARPDGTSDHLVLQDRGEGRFDAPYAMSITGTYRFRVFATGDSAGTPFRREKTVTGGVSRAIARPGDGDFKRRCEYGCCCCLCCLWKWLVRVFKRRRRDVTKQSEAAAMAIPSALSALIKAERGKPIAPLKSVPRRQLKPEEAQEIRKKIFNAQDLT